MVIAAPSLGDSEVLGELRVVVDRAFAKAKEARDVDLMTDCIALITELDRRMAAAEQANLLRRSNKSPVSP